MTDPTNRKLRGLVRQKELTYARVAELMSCSAKSVERYLATAGTSSYMPLPACRSCSSSGASGRPRTTSRRTGRLTTDGGRTTGQTAASRVTSGRTVSTRYIAPRLSGLERRQPAACSTACSTTDTRAAPPSGREVRNERTTAGAAGEVEGRVMSDACTPVYGGPCGICGCQHPAGTLCPGGDFIQRDVRPIRHGQQLVKLANKAFGYRECLRIMLLDIGIDDVSATRLLDLARDRHVSEFMAELAAQRQGGE